MADFDSLWNFNNPAETESRFRELLPKTEGPLRAELFTQIARTQGLQRRFEDADRTLDSVAADVERPGYETARIRFHLERGRVLNSSKKGDRGREHFEKALAQAGTRHADYAVDAAHMLAIISEPDAALDWNRRAIAMAEAATDARARGWLGALYNNTGWALHDKGDIPAALEVFRKALAWREEKKQAAEIRIAKWCVAKMLRLLKKEGDALAMQQALHAEWEEAKEPDGYVYEELGECLLALGRGKEAAGWFGKAWESLSKDEWVKANEAARLERMKSLSRVE